MIRYSILLQIIHNKPNTCADLEGGSGGSGPPLEFAKLKIADINGNEKLVIFHICSLPQLYVKQNQSTK